MKKMQIKFKDVAHLYVGCQVECINEKSNSDNEYFGLFANLTHYTMSMYLNDKWKPILRHLSDMTEEEQTTLYGHWRIIKNPFHEIQLEAKQIVWLLSKHFDLFELIESNQALDLTKIITKNNGKWKVLQKLNGEDLMVLLAYALNHNIISVRVA